MDLTPLKSSNLEGAHYDSATSTLTVKFKSGGAYRYKGVPKKHFDEMCAAESPGAYLHQHIKGAFPHAKAE